MFSNLEVWVTYSSVLGQLFVTLINNEWWYNEWWSMKTNINVIIKRVDEMFDVTFETDIALQIILELFHD